MVHPPSPADLTARLMAARQRLTQLQLQYQAGELDQLAFDSARARLAVPDGQGGFWMPDAQERWLYYDGQRWAPALPSWLAAPPVAMTARSAKTSPWLLLGGLALVVLVAGWFAWRSYGADFWGRSLLRAATPAPVVSATHPATPGADPLLPTLTPLAPLAPDIHPSASDGRLLWREDFDSDDGRWAGLESETSQVAVDQGQYVVTVRQPNKSTWTSDRRADTDAFFMLGDVLPLDEQRGSHGIIFLQSEAGYYRLEVDIDGRYRVRLRYEDAWREPLPWTAATSLRTGLTPNRLGVAVGAGQITLYANGHELGTLPEPLGLTGRAGVFVATDAAGHMHSAAFDNLKVYAPFDGPAEYTADQMQLIMDAGLPQSFALAQFEMPDGASVRHETWSYHDAGLAFLFEDGRYVTWEEAEALPPSTQPNAWRPDQFALGAPLSAWQPMFDADAWGLLGDETLLGLPLTLYTDGQVVLGFYEQALALVHAPAQLGGAP